MNTFSFMAVATGRESTEGSSIKRYIGVAPVFVKAVNPTKEELEKIYNTEFENGPVYTGEMNNSEGKSIKFARVDFIVTSDINYNGVEFTTKVSMFVRNENRFNKDKTKVQVIDKYGRTAWVTAEQMKTHAIPQYSNGPANIDADYRMAYIGEEDLTNFIKAYLNIPNVQSYVDGKWVPNNKVNAEDCECRLEKIADYFNGDFKELQQIAKFQPNNKVKVMFGVRTTDDNKQYQAAYTQMFLKNSITDYSRLDKDLQDRKNAGSYPTTEFKVCDIKEYVVEPTDLSKSDDFAAPTGETPWGN